MAPEESNDFLIHERLESLGVSLLSEWDVLVFLYRHNTSLTSAAQIAHLLGESRAAVSAALDRLESLGLLQRSRGSQGVRLYRFAVPPNAVRYSCFIELLRLAAKRPGRMLLLKNLHRSNLQTTISTGGLPLA